MAETVQLSTLHNTMVAQGPKQWQAANQLYRINASYLVVMLGKTVPGGECE